MLEKMGLLILAGFVKVALIEQIAKIIMLGEKRLIVKQNIEEGRRIRTFRSGYKCQYKLFPGSLQGVNMDFLRSLDVHVPGLIRMIKIKNETNQIQTFI